MTAIQSGQLAVILDDGSLDFPFWTSSGAPAEVLNPSPGRLVVGTQLGASGGYAALVTSSACGPGYFDVGATRGTLATNLSQVLSPSYFAETCEPCPAGSYQSEAAQTACELCPAGLVQPLSGRATCNECGPGEFQPQSGQTSCLVAPPSQPPSAPETCGPRTSCGSGTMLNQSSGACEISCDGRARRQMAEEPSESIEPSDIITQTVASYMSEHPELQVARIMTPDEMHMHMERILEQHFGQPALE